MGIRQAIVAIPLFLAGTFIAAAGAGILFAALIVAYRDFRYVIGFLVQLWMFATPVFYPLDVVPARWHWLYAINPMVGMVGGFRWALLGTSLPADVILISTLSAAALMAAGIQYFLQVERRFADII